MNTTLNTRSDSADSAIYWRVTLVSLVAAAMLALSGCSGMTRREQGTLIGATAGAVVGGAVTGTTTGAAIGAAAGGVVGNEVAKKKH